MERLNNTLSKLNSYGLTLPSILAVLPFFISAIITMRVTYGDATQAQYIISEIGFLQLWIQGANALFLTYIPILFAVLVTSLTRKAFKQKSITFGIAALIGSLYVLYTTSILNIILAIFLVFVVAPLATKSADKESKQHSKLVDQIENGLEEVKINNNKDQLDLISSQVEKLKNEKLKSSSQNTALLIIGILSALTIVTWSYPMLPQSSITTRDSSVIKGMIMSRSEVRTVIYDTKSSSIKVLQATEIIHEDVCDKRNNQAFYGLNWSVVRHILEHNNRPSIPYVTCVN